ncbi:hypothetical protein [Lysobacter sp.]|uniref:hypothetical protein n=1 Tax=Lysobacter sp. TaxID=72226 RepID=UPI002D31581C|nr:hypothetical protein [Lysobacter sp.]HZX78221.1 hypothetical protein [Lysobacter sp.]
MKSSITAVLSQRFGFTSRSNVVAAAVAGLIVAGLVSVILGQDRNWDLMNYHYYAAYAYLNDRVGVDLAPVGLQSYFPPMLDVPYFWLSTRLHPVILSFLMGAWQGVCFILLSGVAWTVLRHDARRAIRAPLLGLAGMLSAVFLSEFGNTMGDNSTAPLVLGALLLAIGSRDRSGDSVRHLLLCGICMGLAVGLKLTNAIYAVALAVAIMAGEGRWVLRLYRLVLVTCSALAAFGVLTGAWFRHMWLTFRNPLLPQFNSWFQSPLAGETMVSDTRWLPKTGLEWVTWPIQMTLDPTRVGEVGLRQIVWLLLFIAMIWWGIKSLRAWRQRELPAAPALAVPQRQLLTFVATSFVVWMAMFSIHRYLAAAEMLAPIALWIVIHRISSGNQARHVASGAVAACALVAVLGWSHWGRAGLGKSGFQVEVPESNPLPATVLMTGIEPQGWIIPLLPEQYRFVGLSGFPEGPAYHERARAVWRETPDRIYAILPADDDRRQQRVVRLNRAMGWLGVNKTCARLQWWAAKLKLETQPQSDGIGLAGQKCELVLPASRRIDLTIEDRQSQEQAVQILSRHNLQLLGSSCLRKQASIGTDLQSYQWCRVVEIEPG